FSFQQKRDEAAGFIFIETIQPGLDHKHIGIKRMDGFEQSLFFDIVQKPGLFSVRFGDLDSSVPELIEILFSLLKAVIGNFHIEFFPVAEPGFAEIAATCDEKLITPNLQGIEPEEIQ